MAARSLHNLLLCLHVAFSVNAVGASGGNVRVFPADGYGPSQYSDIVGAIENEKLKLVSANETAQPANTISVCVAHSTGGRDAAARDDGCDAIVLLGAFAATARTLTRVSQHAPSLVAMSLQISYEI